jgi:hypothetical protein
MVVAGLLGVIATLAIVAPSVAAQPQVLLCTRHSGAPGPATFVNNTTATLQLYWVDYGCVEQLYATIPAGQSFVQQVTYTGHIWRMRDANGAYLQDVTVVPNQTYFARSGPDLVAGTSYGDACPRGGLATSWSLRNDSSAPLDVYWLDESSCSEVRIGAVAVRATQRFNSFVGHRFRIKVAGSDRVVAEPAVTALTSSAVIGPLPPAPPPRMLTDRPDSVSGPQVKVVYAVPSDGVDDRLDVSGRIGASIAAGQDWLATQSGGRRFRVDLVGGQPVGVPDIAFVRLPRTAAAYQANLPSAREAIEHDLQVAGFNRADKRYLVFYAGRDGEPECGNSLAGGISVIYLPSCGPGPTGDPGRVGYTELVWVHEVFHSLGAVAGCAPNAFEGHVSDDPSDLMFRLDPAKSYPGGSGWRPALLDVGSDDYWGAGAAACLDVSRSPYVS